jgi:hypothetical protein
MKTSGFADDMKYASGEEIRHARIAGQTFSDEAERKILCAMLHQAARRAKREVRSTPAGR